MMKALRVDRGNRRWRKSTPAEADKSPATPVRSSPSGRDDAADKQQSSSKKTSKRKILCHGWKIEELTK
ncbi:hypothetical protein L1887_18774 [Cichorium endivia]|nr:hypothetical protein L1887_18774 [Cichorium endivia]